MKFGTTCYNNTKVYTLKKEQFKFVNLLKNGEVKVRHSNKHKSGISCVEVVGFIKEKKI
jgi:hypothetical protein